MPIALLSVTDKTDLVPFARELVTLGFEILSSGGTARALRDEDVPVTTVEDYTGSPEVMDGRVKTLHPRVHGGILSRGERDEGELERLGGRAIDLVVVNLYPFETVLARPEATPEQLIENIDIGGPSMIRSAAKNHARVTVVVDSSDYPAVLRELREHRAVSIATRRRLAAKAFARTAAYDGAIAGALSSKRVDEHEADAARFLSLSYERGYSLRYGENPHQKASFYVDANAKGASLAHASSLGAEGKELSYNNFLDADAAMKLAYDFLLPAAAVIKHTNPCGVSLGNNIEEAYLLAREADRISAFGGIVALNREVDEATAKLLHETFLECVIAPSYAKGALELLRTKKNLRILATQGTTIAPSTEVRSIAGGVLVQAIDRVASDEMKAARVVTKRAPTESEMNSLGFVWTVTKHVKSNAIVLASDRTTVGVGAGQMSRIDSVRIACEKAGEKAKGAVLGSDAFFPFPDGVELAARAGVVAIAQPGGSVKDPEVIAAADRLGIAMVFTGFRHFKH